MKAREVVGDQNSLEVDEMRRAFNRLVLVLENIATQVDASDITATEAFTVLATNIASGRDDSITGVGGGGNNYVGTELSLEGVAPTPLHPRRHRGTKVVDVTVASEK